MKFFFKSKNHLQTSVIEVFLIADLRVRVGESDQVITGWRELHFKQGARLAAKRNQTAAQLIQPLSGFG